MSQQKLDRTKIPCPTVDQYRLRASERVRPELRGIEPDASHPLLHKPRILPGGESARAVVFATGEQKLAGRSASQSEVLVDRLPRLIGHLEPDWPAGLLLSDGGPIHRVAARRNIIDADGDDVTATQLAVDRQVEQRQIALLALDLELGSDRPDVAWS